MMIEESFDTKNSVLIEVQEPLFKERNVQLVIKRDDLIHDEVSGNKWRKLKYNILKCADRKHEGILTFGGAYSNHLLATAYACSVLGLKSVGIVRGDELNEKSNKTLERCHSLGMKLVFVSREEYNLRKEKFYKDELAGDYSNFWMVPEGGANYYGVLGCQELLGEIDIEFDEVFVAQGTTTTSAGIALSLPPNSRLNVVPVLKGFNSKMEMKSLLISSGYEQEFVEECISEVRVVDEYHFGGYGKYSDDLLSFIRAFYTRHKIKLDPIYTGKVMFGLYDMIEKGELDGKRILFIHTGGIQGSAGVEANTGLPLYPEI